MDPSGPLGHAAPHTRPRTPPLSRRGRRCRVAERRAPRWCPTPLHCKRPRMGLTLPWPQQSHRGRAPPQPHPLGGPEDAAAPNPCLHPYRGHQALPGRAVTGPSQTLRRGSCITGHFAESIFKTTLTSQPQACICTKTGGGGGRRRLRTPSALRGDSGARRGGC